MKQNQEWFLIKKNWSEWILSMSDEDAGKFLKLLYGLPCEGLVNTLFSSIQPEFMLMNQTRDKYVNARKSKASKAANTRWGNAQASSSNASDKFDDSDDTMLKHAQAMPVNMPVAMPLQSTRLQSTRVQGTSLVDDQSISVVDKSLSDKKKTSNNKPKTAIQLALEKINSKK